jgi:hypothetical protein
MARNDDFLSLLMSKIASGFGGDVIQADPFRRQYGGTGIQEFAQSETKAKDIADFFAGHGNAQAQEIVPEATQVAAKDLPVDMEVSAGSPGSPTAEIMKLIGDTRNGQPIDRTGSFKGGGGGFMRAPNMVFAEPVDPTARIKDQAIENALRAAQGQTPQNWYEPRERAGGAWASNTLQKGRNLSDRRGREDDNDLGQMLPGVKASIGLGNLLAQGDVLDPELEKKLREQAFKKGELGIGKETLELRQAMEDPQSKLIKQALGTAISSGGPQAEIANQTIILSNMSGISLAEAFAKLQGMSGSERRDLFKNLPAGSSS